MPVYNATVPGSLPATCTSYLPILGRRQQIKMRTIKYKNIEASFIIFQNHSSVRYGTYAYKGVLVILADLFLCCYQEFGSLYLTCSQGADARWIKSSNIRSVWVFCCCKTPDNPSQYFYIIFLSCMLVTLPIVYLSVGTYGSFCGILSLFLNV